jgi:molybdate-binding protein
MSNVGLGVEPAARQFNLDFIPVATERYMLVAPMKAIARPAIRGLIDLLMEPEFAEVIGRIPGYVLDSPGKVCTFASIFPWLRKDRAVRT